MTLDPFLQALPAALPFMLGEILIVAATGYLVYRLLALGIDSILDRPSLAKFSDLALDLKRHLRRVLWPTTLVLAFVVVGTNLYLIHRGVDPATAVLDQLRRLDAELWTQVTVIGLRVAGFVVLAVVVLGILRAVLKTICKQVKGLGGIRSNDESLEKLFAWIDRVTTRTVWVLVLVLSLMHLEISARTEEMLRFAIVLYLIILAGSLAWRAIDLVVATIGGLSEKYAQKKNLARYHERLESLLPLLRKTLEYLVYLGVTSVVALQIEAMSTVADWGLRLIRIVGLFFLVRVIIELVHLLVEEGLTSDEDVPQAQKKRRLTLIPVVNNALSYVIYTGFAILVLRQVGIDPTPFLAGIGIVGLALGFGAQSLVSDLVAGLFTLLEEYYLVGDFIEIDEAQGNVESIDLRTTRLRDVDGRLHIFRNGEIGKITNYSKHFACAVVDVGVSYRTNLDQAYSALEDVGKKAHAEHADVLEPSRVQGVTVYAESSLIIRLITRVSPGCHIEIAHDLRKRIKEAFEIQGIEIAPTISLEGVPYPSH